MRNFVFTKYAEKQFLQLEISLQKRIFQKLQELKHMKNTALFLKPLKSFQYASHRIRIGDYRLIVNVLDNSEKIIILKVGHRKNIYNS
jgi:mRNA interferase RelE/StbE